MHEQQRPADFRLAFLFFMVGDAGFKPATPAA
jgi:hypothetical protein